MDVGLNNHLKKISSELFIKHGSLERFNIDRSLSTIIDRLEEYFGSEIDEIMVFGSYTRDTILPRSFDSQSDIDILIQFNTKDFDKLRPESYRTQLKKFAERNYPKAAVIKDHPSIVLELNHIKFDLVPSVFDEGFFYDSIEIPDKNGGWMETEPEKFNQKLVQANKRYCYIVKPIIRMLKFWNARQNYPYSSYDLEKRLANMNFNNDSLESGFLYAIRNLSTDHSANWIKNAVNNLKYDAEKVKHCLKEHKLIEAKRALDRILPGFFE